MKNILKYTLIAISFLVSSCQSWIEITPTDRLTEDMVFSNKEGFKKALNGVYIELNSTTVYGQNMSAGMIDVLAQYYNLTSEQHPLYYYFKYTYTQANVKSGFDLIWQKTYKLISNCNIIIEKCGDSNPLLPEPYFGMIKGEALALRAMLHLDMLRLFGPIYSTGSAKTCIPYMTIANQEVQPLLTAEKVMDNILKDLNDAIALLETSDPVITNGVRNYADQSGNNDMNYRQYRLNYFAVKALLARAYLWKGDKVNALSISEEILSQTQITGSEIFPFVTNANATNSTAPDRVFSTEVLFSLYYVNRKTLQTNLFDPNLDPTTAILTAYGTLTTGRVNEMYDDKNDYRYNAWANYNKNGSNILYLRKYEDMTGSTTTNAWRYMIPLIRLSEVYFIAAECTDDLTLATQYLNKVRTGRNCFSVAPATRDALMTFLSAEYRREMIGEGQLFFFYKRLAMANIPNGIKATGNMNISLDNYVVPLPTSEISMR